jgi:hypothetical protein
MAHETKNSSNKRHGQEIIQFFLKHTKVKIVRIAEEFWKIEELWN